MTRRSLSPARKKRNGHQFGEAFMLMWYACEKCGHRECIWNSRNGVTPFCLQCPSCSDLSLQHIDWHGDERAPDHKLNPGQQFFRDGTPDEAEARMRWRIEFLRDKYPLTDNDSEQMVREARAGKDETGNSNEFAPGWPKLDRQSL